MGLVRMPSKREVSKVAETSLSAVTAMTGVGGDGGVGADGAGELGAVAVGHPDVGEDGGGGAAPERLDGEVAAGDAFDVGDAEEFQMELEDAQVDGDVVHEEDAEAGGDGNTRGRSPGRAY